MNLRTWLLIGVTAMGAACAASAQNTSSSMGEPTATQPSAGSSMNNATDTANPASTGATDSMSSGKSMKGGKKHHARHHHTSTQAAMDRANSSEMAETQRLNEQQLQTAQAGRSAAPASMNAGGTGMTGDKNENAGTYSTPQPPDTGMQNGNMQSPPMTPSPGPNNPSDSSTTPQSASPPQ